MMTIQFYGELTEELGMNIVNQLLDIYEKNQTILEANDRLKYKADHLPLYCDEITFLISSPGGLLYSFMDIWDAIDKLKQQGVVFKGRVSSFAMSAGFYTYCLMDYREMSPYATLMCHEMSVLRNEKLTNLDLEVKRMAKIQAQLDKLVTDNTKITQEMLDKSKGTDLYFDYDMALEYGIIKEEPTEEELMEKLMLGEEKETMTESEWDEFITELKDYINIIPDKDSEEMKQEELDEMYCIETAICKEHEGTYKCCYYCGKYEECDMSCDFVLEIGEEFSCKYLTDKPVQEVEKESTEVENCKNCECKQQEEITEWKCGVATTCDSICCKFCDKFLENIYCEDMCDTVSKDMKFDDCEFAKEK